MYTSRRERLMHYREAYSSDIEQIASFYNELAYYIQQQTHDAYWDFGKLETEGLKEYLKNIIAHEEAILLVAVEEQEIVGFLTGEIMTCHLPISSVKEVGYIAGAYVVEKFRGQGIMKNLEGRAIEFFKNKGLKYVEVNFITNNVIAKESWKGMGYCTFREQARKFIG